jgi:hypothetical protein
MEGDGVGKGEEKWGGSAGWWKVERMVARGGRGDGRW